MSNFHDKVAERIDKLDAAGLRRQYKALVGEMDFFKSVFDSIDEGVIVLDTDGNVQYANRAGAGFAPLLGIGGDADAVSHGAPSGVSVREVEITYPEHRIVEVKRIGRVVKIRDVTEKRALDAAAIENGRADAVGEMAAAMAHEIGNPLNALSLDIQLLKRKYPEEADLGTADKELRRVSGIIREFLGAFRPAKPMLAPGSAADPLKDALAVLKNTFEDRNIRISIDLPQTLPAVAIDRAQMEQVFFNLMKNALEAMKDGGELSIGISNDDTSVSVTFGDTGPGIRDEDLAHLFEPYRSSKKGGSGIGLMISRRIVAAHGGEISAANGKERGTLFTVKLPRLEKRVRELT